MQNYLSGTNSILLNYHQIMYSHCQRGKDYWRSEKMQRGFLDQKKTSAKAEPGFLNRGLILNLKIRTLGSGSTTGNSSMVWFRGLACRSQTSVLPAMKRNVLQPFPPLPVFFKARVLETTQTRERQPDWLCVMTYTGTEASHKPHPFLPPLLAHN